MSISPTAIRYVNGRRPYIEALDACMTPDKWLQIAPDWVEFSDLVFSQAFVKIDGLLSTQAGETPHDGDWLPHVVIWEGQKYLHDGHHRAALALLKGETQLYARVLELP